MPYSKPKYKMYEIVRTKQDNTYVDAAVRGIQHSRDAQQQLYALRLPGGRVVNAQELELEATGQFESPLQYDEIVKIWPQEAEYAYLSGKRGVVSGMSVDDNTGEWGFAIALQTGEVWDFSYNEIKSTGRFLPQPVKDTERTRSLTVKVDQATGEGVLVNGDSKVNIHQYVPYPVNLDDL